MTERRPLDDPVALTVLSELSVVAVNLHDLEQELLWMGRYDDVGKVEAALHDLEEHGLVAVAERPREGAGPRFTLYRITAEGRSALGDRR